MFDWTGAILQESQTTSHQTEKGVDCDPTKRGFDFKERLSGLFAASPFSCHTAQTAENEKKRQANQGSSLCQLAVSLIA